MSCLREVKETSVASRKSLGLGSRRRQEEDMDEDGDWYRAVCIEWQTIDNGNDSAG